MYSYLGTYPTYLFREGKLVVSWSTHRSRSLEREVPRASALAEFGYMYHWGGTCTTKALDLNLSNTGIVPDQPT